MSASKVLEDVLPIFPASTSVKAYPLSNWAQHQLPVSGAPVGTETETATVAADGSLEFVDLLPNTRYVAHAQVSSEERYIHFQTPKWGRAAIVTAGTDALQDIVAAVAGRRILAAGYLLSASGAVTVQWYSGTTNVISGPIKLADTGGVSHPTEDEAPPLECRRGEKLALDTSAAIVVGGHVLYTLEPRA